MLLAFVFMFGQKVAVKDKASSHFAPGCQSITYFLPPLDRDRLAFRSIFARNAKVKLARFTGQYLHRIEGYDHVVIWKVEGSNGQFMSWAVSGINDHGPVTVYAVRGLNGAEWLLQAELPGWESRDEDCRQNVQLWASMNAISIDDTGVARLTVANKGSQAANEMHLARMATLLGCTMQAATFVRRRMGKARDNLAEAA